MFAPIPWSFMIQFDERAYVSDFVETTQLASMLPRQGGLDTQQASRALRARFLKGF